MRIILIIFAFIFCHELFAQEQTLSVRAELVWVESNARDHKLMFSELSAGEWSAPTPIYNTESFISTPTISTDLSQNKLIIWSEQSNNSSVLMSARKLSSERFFQRAEKINDFKAENLSPSVVIDISNRVWVFWSSNFEGLDDIYYSHQEGLKWSSPKRVHAKNAVPDIQPLASLNQDLDVVVTWKSYNLKTAQYLTVQKTFTIDSLSKSRYKSGLINNTEDSISDIVLPSFLPRNSAVGLHFPNNQIEQSMRFGLNR